jgi:hypothetical protein
MPIDSKTDLRTLGNSYVLDMGGVEYGFEKSVVSGEFTVFRIMYKGLEQERRNLGKFPNKITAFYFIQGYVYASEELVK